MRLEEIRSVLRARPFRPFTMYTPDGGAIPVWHGDFALLSPDGRTMTVYQRDSSFNIVDVMLITRFAFDPSPEPAENTSAGTA